MIIKIAIQPSWQRPKQGSHCNPFLNADLPLPNCSFVCCLKCTLRSSLLFGRLTSALREWPDAVASQWLCILRNSILLLTLLAGANLEVVFLRWPTKEIQVGGNASCTSFWCFVDRMSGFVPWQHAVHTLFSPLRVHIFNDRYATCWPKDGWSVICCGGSSLWFLPFLGTMWGWNWGCNTALILEALNTAWSDGYNLVTARIFVGLFGMNCLERMRLERAKGQRSCK